MKYTPLFALVILMMSVTTQTNGQVKALVNEVATDIDQTNGNLTAIYKKYPNYMNGFEKAPFDPFKKVPPRLNVQNYAETTVPAISTKPNKPKATATASVKDVNASKTNKSNKFVYFVGESTDFNKESLPKFTVYASGIKSGKSKSVLIKGWYKTGDKASQSLIQNRLNKCKSKLEENGVPSNLILTSILGSNRQERHLTVLMQ